MISTLFSFFLLLVLFATSFNILAGKLALAATSSERDEDDGPALLIIVN